MMKAVAVFTSIDTPERARAIANALVEQRLAACVQISKIESVYAWQGRVQHENEYRILVKTTDARYADVETAIRELHSYDLPAVYAFDMAQVYGPFGEWIIDNSSGELA